MQPPKTPDEIAEIIEALTGQPARDNLAHTLWTHIWQQLEAIHSLLHLQTKYFEFFLIEHMKYSRNDIAEFVARGESAENE